jgi:hypothetical protein
MTNFILTPDAMKALFGDISFIPARAGRDIETGYRKVVLKACDIILDKGTEAAIDYLYDEMKMVKEVRSEG